jgi:hypothetical protein
MAEADYSTSAVYRENDTGKIRVRGATKIEFTDSPADAAEIAAKLDEVIALLTAAGINPDA